MSQGVYFIGGKCPGGKCPGSIIISLGYVSGGGGGGGHVWGRYVLNKVPQVFIIKRSLKVISIYIKNT